MQSSRVRKLKIVTGRSASQALKPSLPTREPPPRQLVSDLFEQLRSGAECRVPNGHRRRSDQNQLREVGSTSTWSSQDPPETSERLLICRPLSRSSMLPVWAIRREQHPLCLHRYARDYTTNLECLCAQSGRCSEAAR